jgi:hypothetical protein
MCKGGPVAEARYDAASSHPLKPSASHPLKPSANASAITSFGCGVIGLAVQLPLMLFVISRHPIPGNVWSESVLLSVLPFLGIFFGATGLDQIKAQGQRGRRFAGIGLLIGIIEFVPILLFLLSRN